MQPSAPSGEGGARALTVAAENALELATGRGGRAEPACALATVALLQGSGGGGGIVLCLFCIILTYFYLPYLS